MQAYLFLPLVGSDIELNGISFDVFVLSSDSSINEILNERLIYCEIELHGL